MEVSDAKKVLSNWLKTKPNRSSTSSSIPSSSTVVSSTTPEHSEMCKPKKLRRLLPKPDVFIKVEPLDIVEIDDSSADSSNVHSTNDSFGSSEHINDKENSINPELILNGTEHIDDKEPSINPELILNRTEHIDDKEPSINPELILNHTVIKNETVLNNETDEVTTVLNDGSDPTESILNDEIDEIETILNDQVQDVLNDVSDQIEVRRKVEEVPSEVSVKPTKICEKSCCVGEQIPRGEPVKSKDEVDPYDIGLIVDKIRTFDEDELYKSIKNIWKPPPTYKFPQYKDCDRHWSFNPTYIDEKSPKFLPWLAYSAYFDGVFCVPCVCFGDLNHQGVLTKLFKEPFTRWNGAPTRWFRHGKISGNSFHNSSITCYRNFMSRMKEKIDPSDSHADRCSIYDQIAINCEKLTPILKTIVLCGRQNLAIRGHQGDKKLVDHINDRGNFQALLDFRIDAGDHTLNEHLETARKNSTHSTFHIQNEIIMSCKRYIQGKLLEKIKGKFFSIVMKEASDNSDKQQVSISLRFVDGDGDIREMFMEYIHAPYIKHLLMDVLENNYGLDLKFCRGQCYDLAFNMSGIYSEVTSIINNKSPKALYSHSFSHPLNLIIALNCPLRQVRNIMDIVSKCHDMFQHSQKKKSLLEKCIEDKERYLGVCETGWMNRMDGLQLFQEMLQPILNVLERISDNYDGSYNSDARADASGLLHRICSADFIINLVILWNILSYIYPLTLELRSLKADMAAVYAAVDTSIPTLKQCRKNVEKMHEEWYQIAKKVCYLLDVPVTLPRLVKIPTDLESFENSSYYRTILTIPFLDSLIVDLEQRFTRKHRIHGNGFYIIPSCVVTNVDWNFTTNEMDEFIRNYGDDLPNPSLLPTEMNLWKQYWLDVKKGEGNVPDNVSETIKKVTCRKHWFPNLYTILELVACVPSSSDPCECSMSKSRRLKTYLRSTVHQEKRNGLALLYTHSEIDIDYNEFIDKFVDDHPYRMRLKDILNGDSM